jgi:pyruvate,water dikinase
MDNLQQGDVLVAEMTKPEFVVAMKRASAIVTVKGGRTCHAAIVSRELGVPCIVGAAGAISILGKVVGVVTVKVEVTGGEVLQ